MQKIDIDTIMKQFDQYVEISLKNKSSQEQQTEHSLGTNNKIKSLPNNQLDLYYQSMQKRLKIKTVTQDQKFQNMLGPMKKLKSFVSIKQFLRGLNNNNHNTMQKPSIKSENVYQQTTYMSQNTKRKLQYEDLRGGLYMEKVQNHLRRNHLKRKLDDQAEYLLKELEDNQSEKNQYRMWMENILGKINMKEECFLIKPNEALQQFQDCYKKDQLHIFQDLTNQNTQNTKGKTNLKRENLKRRMSEQQEQKNFKKVSNFLAQRLRKILTDKYVNNSSKKTKKNKNILMINEDNFQNDINCYQASSRMITQPPNIAATYRKAVCRTTATSKRMRDSVKNDHFRAQTSQLKNRKPSLQNIWKKNINTKMNDILNIANTEYKKCALQKKQNKMKEMNASGLAKQNDSNFRN